MRMTLAQVAALVGGTVQGDPSVVVENAAGLAEAGERDISFLSNSKYGSHLKATKAAAVLLSPGVDAGGRPAIIVKDTHFAWAQVLGVLEKERLLHPRGIHPSSVVAKGVKIGANVSLGACAVVEEGAEIGDDTVVYPHCYIGRDVKIGKGCLLYPNVTIRERVKIGDRCVFQPGAVIGSDGFGFAFHQGRHHKVPQVGTVDIGDDVEVQANSTVDRAAVGATKIGKGTKVDNLVQIAHNVEIGEHCLVVALTGIAGSAKLGDYVTLAAQVGVAGHLTIGDQAQVGAKAGVTQDVEPKAVVWGLPAHPLRDELKTLAAVRRLPQLFEDVKALKKSRGI